MALSETHEVQNKQKHNPTIGGQALVVITF